MYWNSEGREHTEKTINLAMESAKKNSIKHIVIASNSGKTARLLVNKDFNKDFNIVCVTHVYGFKTPGENEMSEGERIFLQNNGIKVLTTGHVLSGVERSFSTNFGGIYPVEIIAYTLRMFGQGVKVCVEIATMALDSGLIPYGEKVVAVGGSSRGSDTAIIIIPSYSKDIFSTRIEEIICKPR